MKGAYLLFLCGIFLSGCCCRPLPYQPVYIVAEKDESPIEKAEAPPSEIARFPN